MFVKHSLVYLLAQGIPSLIAFLAIVIYTRILTPAEFGIYALVYTGAILISSIFFQWLRLGLLRFYQARSDDGKTKLLASIFKSFWQICAIVLAISLPFTLFVGDWKLVLLTVINGFSQAAFSILLERSRVELSPFRYGLVSIARASLMLIMGIAGFEIYGIDGLLSGLFIGNTLVVVYESLQLRPFFKWSSASRLEVLNLLHYGLPLTATFALAGIMGFADRYMLLWMDGQATAGQYSAAYDFTQKVIVTLMMIINLSGYPLLLKADSDRDTEMMHQRLLNSLNGLLFIGLPMTLIFVALSSQIADAFLGQAFHVQAARLLPWLGLAALIEGLKVYYFDLSFQLRQRTVMQVWVVALAALLNILLNILLIPKLAELGAAISTIIANALALSLSFALSRKQLQMPLWSLDTAKISIAAGFMWLVSVYFIHSSMLNNNPWIELVSCALAGLFAYALLLFAFNTFSIRQHSSRLLRRLQS